MERAQADGRWVEFEETGEGEPVLLVHGSLIADSLRPVMQEPALSSSYRLIRYRRRGFFANPVPLGAGWLSIQEHAGDAAMLLDRLEVTAAHVVGHDLGAVVALQLALDRPQLVHSLALLEPVLLGVPSADAAMTEVSPAIDRFLGGDAEGAVRALLEIGAASESLELAEERLPGCIEQAARDSESFFGGEMFALGEWRLPDDVGYEITQPVLVAVGEHPAPFFAEGRDLLRRALPQVESLDVFNATHLLPLENPEMLAHGLAWFLRRHPMRR